MGKLKNRSKRVLWIGLGLAFALCMTVFLSMIVFMNDLNTSTISRVSGIYMQGMSEQISLHFETIIESKLDQVKALVDVVSSDNDFDSDKKVEHLASHASALGFEYFGLMSADGNFEMIYGDEISISDPIPFINSLNRGDAKIAVGKNSNGDGVILMGASAEYSMSENRKSVAMVAAVNVDYIADILSLDVTEDSVYSFIIREDGSFVIKTGDVVRDNYFDIVDTVYNDLDELTTKEYLEKLQQAMHDGSPFSCDMQVNGERRHIYATKLSHSEWYLLTFMPYGVLEEAIDDLGHYWFIAALICCVLILAVLITIFAVYSKILRGQLHELQIARDDAETARKQAEHANRAKSEFLSNMSHDIRTPMNAIVGMTAIAQSNIEDVKQVKNCLKKISLSSKHLLGLINDVLDMSKIENGKMILNNEKVSLREVMDSIVNIIQPQLKLKNQKFDVFIYDIYAENVYCDSVRLNQVILNFLSNAIKFTPNGGNIQVSLYEEPSEKGENYVKIHLSVKDNGIGMSAEFKNRIFESFVREDNSRVNKIEGTGLGMAITNYIIEAMGGTIEVESEQGVGSEFKVTVDFEKAQVEEEDMILPAWNMLVVDDDQKLCDSVVSSLNSMGISADWTLDGESAVKMMLEKQNEGDGYQIVLLDWHLPSIDGIETARQIHQIMGDDVPILLISAYDCTEVEKNAENAGIRGFLSKPLFKSTLYYGLKQFSDSADRCRKPGREKKNIDFTGKRILLAEDNELNWEIAYELLSSLGLELEWAENGQVCFEKFRASEQGYYDAVFMDIRMPVMTGYDAAVAIKALDREDAVNIPIIAMTADAFAEDVKKCLDCGMCAHIAKPIDLKEISRVLEKFIE